MDIVSAHNLFFDMILLNHCFLMILKSNSLPKIFMKKFIIFVSRPIKLETLLFVIDFLKTKFATSSLLPNPKGKGG